MFGISSISALNGSLPRESPFARAAFGKVSEKSATWLLRGNASLNSCLAFVLAGGELLALGYLSSNGPFFKPACGEPAVCDFSEPCLSGERGGTF